MFNLDYYLSLYLFIFSGLMFSFFYKHLMLMVISLEFLSVSLTYNMFIIMMYLEMSSYMILMMLIFFVCEGALILSLVVLIVNKYGNDFMKSLSLMKW